MGTNRQVNISASLKQPFALFDVAANVFVASAASFLPSLHHGDAEDPAGVQQARSRTKGNSADVEQQQC